jgi:tryptophanase
LTTSRVSGLSRHERGLELESGCFEAFIFCIDNVDEDCLARSGTMTIAEEHLSGTSGDIAWALNILTKKTRADFHRLIRFLGIY